MVSELVSIAQDQELFEPKKEVGKNEEKCELCLRLGQLVYVVSIP